jgi:hypothetical protein
MKALGWSECDVVELDIDDVAATALGIALKQAVLDATRQTFATVTSERGVA